MTVPESSRKDPVAVYTMGKVGSSSVTDALEAGGFETLQVHVLAGGLGQLERRLARRPDVRHLQSSVKVSHLVDAHQPIKIVSLVREPISRNVSAFFQNFGRLVGGDIDEYSVAEVQQLITEKVLPEEPQAWLDNEFQAFTQVDLDRHRLFEGPAIANEGRWPTLLLRSDHDDDLKSASLSEFLNDESVVVQRNKNVTAEKKGGSMSSVIKRLGLPSDYVDACLSQPFVSMTWSIDEIEKYRQRWTATPVLARQR